ncbi:MAG: hypothetical protein K6E10_03800 [Eubacterium sp.]|nr:hypothetical protein [Eubacterium sp.]
MSDSKNNPKDKNKQNNSPHIEKAEMSYKKNMEKLEAEIKRREKFLEKNDDRLDSLRKLDEEILRRGREKTDKRIRDHRQTIEEKIVKGEEEKEEKLRDMTRKTDDRISSARKKQDKIRENHKKDIEKKRKAYEEKAKKREHDRRIILENRLKKAKNDPNNLIGKRNAITIAIGLVCLMILFIIVANVLHSNSDREKTQEASPTDAAYTQYTNYEKVETLKPEKHYSDPDGTNEQKRLWNTLMEYYDNNTIPVLGIMCNLRAESKFKACNLEDYNNEMWSVDDQSYTDSVNSGDISKKDFLEARTHEITNGYYNDYYQWVNVDGGYGYAQYTAYVKKEELYQYAEQWFSPGGRGEDYRFNIADPEMQAYYIIYLLKSDDFKALDNKLRNAPTVVDACYAWLRFYEVPYDPYCDNYFTLSFDRAAYADEIEQACAGEKGGE